MDIAGALGALDFESVSGDLILATERALHMDAKTTSGAVRLHLPEFSGFDLDFSTTSGTLESPLTDREGTMIACGDRFTHYSVPALEGSEASELTVSTVSGVLFIEASSGSN